MKKDEEEKKSLSVHLETLSEYRMGFNQKNRTTASMATAISVPAASLQQTGLYSIVLPEKSIFEVAAKTGYRFISRKNQRWLKHMLLKFLQELDDFHLPETQDEYKVMEYCVSKLSKVLAGYTYNFEGNAIRIRYEYNLKYDLYIIYFPYLILSRQCPAICQLLLRFICLMQKVGVRLWSDDYHTDSTVDYMENIVEEEDYDEEIMENIKVTIKETKAMREAIEAIRDDSTTSLQNDIQSYYCPDDLNRKAINLMLSYIPFLECGDYIDHYSQNDDNDSDDEYDMMKPENCFLIWTDIDDFTEENFNTCLQESGYRNPAWEATLNSLKNIPALSDFPYRLAEMMEKTYEIICELKDYYSHDKQPKT